MRRTPMKRTGFARSTAGLRHIGDILPDAVAGLKRSGFASQWQPRDKTERTITLTPIRVPVPSAPIFQPTPKQEYVRDEGYRRFVASLACFQCGIAGISQAAHSNQGACGKGLSKKASDVHMFPLCADQPMRRGCHSLHDQCVDMTREERDARELVYLKRMKELRMDD